MHCPPALQSRRERGIEIKYISMGMPADRFELQVVHPEADKIERHLGGRTFDLVVDREELLVGMFETGRKIRPRSTGPKTTGLSWLPGTACATIFSTTSCTKSTKRSSA